MALETGSSVGPYKIIERAGEGGMGVVYKSRDTRLGRLVALKTLPPEKMADSARRSRFIQEAQAASTLNHPNIVVVYDIGAENGIDFIAMEYVDGRNLGELIPRNGMRLADALKIAVQIADGLAKAHAAGIVHRDIKPSNLRVAEDGTVKILDFGLAKLTQVEAGGPDEETATVRADTAEGVIVGTAAYMSPEQVERRKLDGRSDIFSFGAVLYEMLAGRRAFTGESQMSLLTSILHKEPPTLAGIAPGLPPELYRLVGRCLRKDPERRFQHMGDVKVALQELKDESDSGLIAEPAKAAQRRSRAASAAVGLLGTGALAAAVWFAAGRNTPPPPDPVYQPVPFVSHPGDERDPTFSPDGTQIAYAWSGEDNEGLNIYVKLIGPGAPIRLTKTPGDIEPQWSPDGKWIAFMRHSRPGTSIVVIPALGGPERTLREPRSNILAWSADSQWVFADAFGGIIERISLATGERIPVLGKLDGKNVTSPALSPDSSKLAFNVTEGADRVLHSVDLDANFKPSGAPRRLTPGAWSVTSPAFTADGKDILFINGGRNTSSHMWRVPADGSAPPRRLTWAGDYAWFLGVSQRGSRMAFTRLNSDIDIKRIPIEADGTLRKEPEPWLPSTLIESGPAFSPDSAKVAFQSFRSGAAAVWVANADGSQPFQLTHFDGMHTGGPMWSPDGKRIAFHARGDGKQQSDIYLINADGSGLKRLTSDPAVDQHPSWSRDGAHIYFSSNRTGATEVFKMPSGGGAPVQMTRKGALFGVESFDGKWVYLPVLPRAATIRRIPAAGGEEEEIVAAKGVRNGRSFVPSARGIYYLATGDDAPLYLLPEGGQPKQVGVLRRPSITFAEAPFAVSPDGKTLLYCHVASFGSDIQLVENFR